MKSLDLYWDYYWAFEEAYDTDKWNKVITYFTDDASYDSPATGLVKGKENVMNIYQASLNRFDRRFPIKRTITDIEEEQVIEENYLKMPGYITYGNEGYPNLVVYMYEELWFKDGLIQKIVDTIPEEEQLKIQTYLEKYDKVLRKINA